MAKMRVLTNDDMTTDMALTSKAYLLARASINPTNECWEWNFVQRNGYGMLSIGNLRDYAHRWSFRTFNGPIPPGMHVCHKCDNPICINPQHLFVGTARDNMQDAVRKGRISHGAKHSVFVSGERSGMAKLTWRCVRAIRHLHATHGLNGHQLARAFDVTPENINSILRNETWKEAA